MSYISKKYLSRRTVLRGMVFIWRCPSRFETDTEKRQRQ